MTGPRLDEVSPALVDALRALGRDYGPVGVALVAAQLTVPDVGGPRPVVPSSLPEGFRPRSRSIPYPKDKPDLSVTVTVTGSESLGDVTVTRPAKGCGDLDPQASAHIALDLLDYAAEQVRHALRVPGHEIPKPCTCTAPVDVDRDCPTHGEENRT